MSEEKHKEMVSGFWGKAISVIAIPFVVYYCSKGSDEKEGNIKPFNPEIHIPDSPSQHEINIQKSHKLITRDSESLVDSLSD